MTRVICPNPSCLKALRLPSNFVGRRVGCPKCGTHIDVPETATTAPEPAATPADLLLAAPPAPDAVAPPGRAARRDGIAAGALSVAAHIGLVLVLSLAWARADSGAEPASPEVAFAAVEEVALTNSDDGQLDDSAASSGGEPAAELGAPVELTFPMPAGEASADGLDLGLGVAGGGGGGGGGGGFGFGTKGLDGLGGESSFLGTTARAKRFCIIADNSGSMSGPRIEYVKAEVLKTIGSVRGNTRFFITFYNSFAVPQPVKRWSTKSDVKVLAEWLKTIQAQGGNNEITGFEVAFRLDPSPEVIYFMTDGGFDPGQVALIRDGNRRLKKPAVIHTIAFMDNSGEPLLKQIAADGKGTYRFVQGGPRP